MLDDNDLLINLFVQPLGHTSSISTDVRGNTNSALLDKTGVLFGF